MQCTLCRRVHSILSGGRNGKNSGQSKSCKTSLYCKEVPDFPVKFLQSWVGNDTITIKIFGTISKHLINLWLMTLSSSVHTPVLLIQLCCVPRRLFKLCAEAYLRDPWGPGIPLGGKNVKKIFMPIFEHF